VGDACFTLGCGYFVAPPLGVGLEAPTDARIVPSASVVKEKFEFRGRVGEGKK